MSRSPHRGPSRARSWRVGWPRSATASTRFLRRSSCFSMWRSSQASSSSSRTPSTCTSSSPRSTSASRVVLAPSVVSTRPPTWTWNTSPRTRSLARARWRTSPGSRCSTSLPAPSAVAASRCVLRGRPASRSVRNFSSWGCATTCSPRRTDCCRAPPTPTSRPWCPRPSTRTYCGRAPRAAAASSSARSTSSTWTPSSTCAATRS